jgi:hypothetical protein
MAAGIGGVLLDRAGRADRPPDVITIKDLHELLPLLGEPLPT